MPKGKDKKIFITGMSGLLGLNFALEARKRFFVSGSYHAHPVKLEGVQQVQMDLTSFDETEKALRTINPDIIVHTAALTNVDLCETDQPLAQRLNVEATEHVAKVAASLGAKLVHISTDQLFDGTRPWLTESDPTAPLNNYARTKWLAEQAVSDADPNALIIRTNFFGWGTSIRTSFSDWILRGLEGHRELMMFTDVYVTPILINDLVDMTIDLLLGDAAGVYHIGGSERVSKHDFALRLAEVFGFPVTHIRPISVDEFAFDAPRPKDMSLSSRKAENQLQMQMPTFHEGLLRLRSLQEEEWQQELERAVENAPSYIDAPL